MTILESGWNLWVWLVGVVIRRWVWLVDVVVRRYIDILTIIINFPYSTCISSFFASIYIYIYTCRPSVIQFGAAKGPFKRATRKRRTGQ